MFTPSKNNKILLLMLVFSFLYSLCFAQRTPTEKSVEELFKNPKKIEWIKHYKGRVDDINDVGLVLGYDGKECKGFITYLRSRERFKLEGDINGTTLKLRETDGEESVIGHFEGNFDNKNLKEIKVHWYNREKTRAGVLFLEAVEKEVVFPSYCGDNKWVRRYEGLIEGEDAELLIQCNGDFSWEGVAWFKEKNTTYSLKGAIVDDNNFRIIFYDDLEAKVGGIEANINTKTNNISGYWIDKKGKKTKTFLEIVEHQIIGCVEYQDYMANYDLIYPKVNHVKCNDFILDIINNWKEKCYQFVKNLNESISSPGPDDRAIEAASSWFNMDLMDDEFISGILTFNATWLDDYQDYSFIYDINNNEIIELKDIFKKDVDYQKLLKEKALKILQFRGLSGNDDYREWINQASFEYITLRNNGLRVNTEFHPIYGRQSVTIDLFEVKEKLNLNHSVVIYLLGELNKKNRR